MATFQSIISPATPFTFLEEQHPQRQRQYFNTPTLVQDIQQQQQQQQQQQGYLISPRSATFPSISTLPVLPSNASAADTLFPPPHLVVSYHRKYYCEESEDTSRPRFTKEQVAYLEQKFKECQKPTAAIKTQFAEQLGTSKDKIHNWFQNKRQQEQQNKKKLALKTAAMLESAGQRKNASTVPSSPLTATCEYMLKESTRSAALKRSSSLNSSSPMNLPPNVQPTYANTTEASYASLCRALQAAKAGKFSFDNFLEDQQSTLPFVGQAQEYSLEAGDSDYHPASAFSDWGSSRSSVAAWTPTPVGQNEDPFEFDRPSVQPSPAYTEFEDISGNCSPSQWIPVCYQDANAQFAAMVEMNAQNASFAMPLLQPPPSRRPSEEPQVLKKPMARTTAIPPLVADSRKKKPAVSARNSRIQKAQQGAAIPRSPLRLEQFSDGHYFDHTESGLKEESRSSSPFSLELDLKTTPNTPEDCKMSDTDTCGSSVSAATVEPKPQRVTDFTRILDITTPALANGTSMNEKAYFDPSDISFFGLNDPDETFDFNHYNFDGVPSELYSFDLPNDHMETAI